MVSKTSLSGGRGRLRGATVTRIVLRGLHGDPVTLKIIQQWNVPGGPDCITYDAEGRLWVTLRWIGRVGVLDPETGVQEQFRVGRSPHGILIHQNVASR